MRASRAEGPMVSYQMVRWSVEPKDDARLGAQITHLGAAGQGHLAARHRALHLATHQRNNGESTGKGWVYEFMMSKYGKIRKHG